MYVNVKSLRALKVILRYRQRSSLDETLPRVLYYFAILLIQREIENSQIVILYKFIDDKHQAKYMQ